MDQTLKSIGRKGQKGRPGRSQTFKRFVANEYHRGNQSLNQLSLKFDVPQQTVHRWIHQFSSDIGEEINIPPMTDQEQKDMASLQKQVALLKEKLEYEQMRNFALETLADLAKSELGIDIRKNFGAKQPKE